MIRGYNLQDKISTVSTIKKWKQKCPMMEEGKTGGTNKPQQ